MAQLRSSRTEKMLGLIVHEICWRMCDARQELEIPECCGQIGDGIGMGWTCSIAR